MLRRLATLWQAQKAQGFDFVVIDGLWRTEMIDFAIDMVNEDGIVLFDNAESYRITDEFAQRGFSRIDFFGQAPEVILPHCTSLFFRNTAFVFDARQPIPVIAQDD